MAKSILSCRAHTGGEDTVVDRSIVILTLKLVYHYANKSSFDNSPIETSAANESYIVPFPSDTAFIDSARPGYFSRPWIVSRGLAPIRIHLAPNLEY